MKPRFPEHESLLEWGMVAGVGLLVGLLGLLMFGWLAGSLKRSGRKKEAPSARGLAGEHHQQTAVAAAR